MTKLILHIGTHKTGSTAIQKTLAGVQSKLNKEKIRYVKVRPKLITDLWSKSAPIESIDLLKKQLSEELTNKYEKYVLSSEHFFGNPNRLYLNNEFTFENIYKVYGEMDVEFVMFVRRQDEFFQSLFMQKVHQNEAPILDDFLKLDKSALDYLVSIKNLKKFFPAAQVHVFPYDPILLAKEDIIQVFNRVLKSKTLEGFKSEKANVGFSPESKDLYENLTDRITAKQASKLRSILQEVSNKGVFREYDLLTFEAKTDFLKNFEESNKEIAATFWNRPFGIDDFSPIVNVDDIVEDRSADPVVLREKVIVRLLKELENESMKEPQKSDFSKKLITKIKSRLKRK